MWSDLIPILLEKYSLLREDINTSANQVLGLDGILRRYDALCFEMVEGIHTLFMEMIRNQAYIRKVYPWMELELYRSVHLSMIATLEECLAPEVDQLPEFYFQLQKVIQSLRGYCVLLRQDIRRGLHQMPKLQNNRKFRQINLQAGQALEAIDRILKKCLDTGRQITLGKLDPADFAPNEEEVKLLIRSGNFSDSEKSILAELLD